MRKKIYVIHRVPTTRKLADSTGVARFLRTTAALTEAGATFREDAARVVAELEAAADAVSPEGDVRGRLRVAAPLTSGVTQLATVFAELARRHPKLHVHAFYSDRYVDLVGEGFNACVRVGYLPDSILVAGPNSPAARKMRRQS